MSNNDLIVLLVFFLIIFIFGSILNILVLIVYRPNSRYYASIFLIFLMAFFHFIYSFLLTPILIAYVALIANNATINTFFCKLVYFVQISFIGTNISLLVLVSFERFKKIKLLTENKTAYVKHKVLAYDNKKASLFLCVFAFVISLFSFAFIQSKEGRCTIVNETLFKVYRAVILGLQILAYGIIGFFYWKAYFTFRRNKKRIFSIQTPNLMISYIDIKDGRNLNPDSYVGLSNLIVKKEWKVARIFMLVSFFLKLF